MSGHIVKSFDRDLDELVGLVKTMGETVSNQLEKAGRALITLDVALAEEVREGDAVVNGQHVNVDAHVEDQIAMRQPQAVDLRRLLGCSRISVDLERMGDEVRNMARSIVRLHDSATEGVLANRSALVMAVATLRNMIDDVMKAFLTDDTELARAVIRRDRMVDDVFRTTLRSLVTHMVEDPGATSGAIELIWIAKALERVGDHTKNVAETVVFIREGADVRHDLIA